MNFEVTEDTDYVTHQSPVQKKVKQAWKVDLKKLYDRTTAERLLAGITSLPTTYQQRRGFPLQYCMGLGYEQLTDLPNIWRVIAEWETLTNPQQAIKDPAARPVLIATGTYAYQKSPDVDLKGKPVATTAGEPLNYSQQKRAPTYTFFKNYKNYPTKWGKDRDFVNSDNVTIYGVKYKPFELYIPEIEVSYLQYENDFPFYAFQAMVYVNTDENGWKVRLRNAGYHERTVVGREKIWVADNPNDPDTNYSLRVVETYAFKPITLGVNGRPTYPSSPVLLDPNGRAYRQITDNDRKRFSVDWTAWNTRRLAVGASRAGPQPVLYGTGPVVGLQIPGQAQTTGITQKQWQDAVVEISVLNEIKFNDYLPLE